MRKSGFVREETTDRQDNAAAAGRDERRYCTPLAPPIRLRMQAHAIGGVVRWSGEVEAGWGKRRGEV